MNRLDLMKHIKADIENTNTNITPVVIAEPGIGVISHIIDILHQKYGDRFHISDAHTISVNALRNQVNEMGKDTETHVVFLDEFDRQTPEDKSLMISYVTNKDAIPKNIKFILAQLTDLSPEADPIRHTEGFAIYENIVMLTSDTVEATFTACLAKDNEPSDNKVTVNGIVHNFLFDKVACEAHKSIIRDMLRELPQEFREECGGEWSFLKACYDTFESQWTGEHFMMEKLFALGMATDQAQCLLSREMWRVLPGGMPYYMVSAK